MTPEILLVQLGTLFAAGHDPRSVADWTWTQIHRAAQAVQAYHVHLLTSVAGGDSVVTRSEAAMRRAVQEDRDAAAVRQRRPDLSSSDAAGVAATERMIRDLEALGIGVRRRTPAE